MTDTSPRTPRISPVPFLISPLSLSAESKAAELKAELEAKFGSSPLEANPGYWLQCDTPPTVVTPEHPITPSPDRRLMGGLLKDTLLQAPTLIEESRIPAISHQEIHPSAISEDSSHPTSLRISTPLSRLRPANRPCNRRCRIKMQGPDGRRIWLTIPADPPLPGITPLPKRKN